MRTIIKSILIILFALNVSAGFSQYQKGEITIGMSTNYNFIGSGPEVFGFGYRKTKFEAYVGDWPNMSMQEFEISTFGVNLSPKIGFCIFKNSIIGADLNLLYGKTLKNDFYYEEVQLFTGFSPFIRYYISVNNYMNFFMEVNAGTGIGKVKVEDVGTSESYYLSAGLSPGLSLKVNENISFDFAFVYDYWEEKSKEKILNNSLSSKISFLGFEIGITGVIKKRKE
jgi:hypothetical protein